MKYKHSMSIPLQLACILPYEAFWLFARYVFVNVIEYRNLTSVCLLLSVLAADSLSKIWKIYKNRGRILKELVMEKLESGMEAG